MENNELDKILKEKLKGKMKIPSEIEGKIRQKVEEKKKNQFKTINIGNNNGKNNKYKFLKPLISVAAAVVIVFAVGTNLNKLPINNILHNTEVSTVAITSIEPTKSANGVLANDSEFTIHTDGQNYDKEDVKKILYVEPALEYEVSKVSNNEYKLKFKQNIPDNTIVKLQYVKDKITEDSWAYQTSNKLTISEVYPADKEIASKNTTIEIKFSYASVENLSKYVKITPKVEGKWKHLGKVWRFTPSKQLKNNQKYTVSVKSGIKIPEGEELDGDYIFSFKVQEEGTNAEMYLHKTITADDIDTYRPDEQVKIYYEVDSYNGNKPDIAKVQISKFKTIDDFIEYLKTKDYSKAEGKESYSFIHKQGYIQLSKTLPTGYYVASIINSNGSELFNSPLQINSLSAYATATERDVIVWAAEGENLAKDVKVQYQRKEEKTNSQGIAKFENIADGSKTVKYLTIGNNEAKLVVGIYNYDLENYPASYLYTDRPLYKNTDTVNIWGFVPKMLFFDKIEDEFYIELGDEGKQKVT